MVLTNSWGLSLEGLRAVFGGLEEKLTMVYFDPRGMGESAPVVEESDMGLAAVRADFDALRRHLGLEQVHAMGWSNGAMNLVLLAAEHPQTISSAIFVHGAASFLEQDMAAWAEAYPELMAAWGAFNVEMQNPDLSDEERTSRMRALWLEQWFPMSCADEVNGAAMVEEAFADAQFSWAHADYSNRESPVFDARDKLPLITARSLVVAGAHDMMSPDKARELHEGLADSTLVLFEASGHYAPLEEPEAFRKTVYDFLGVE
jgi:pimeloyl-ACP methyl ester carboxylesterase